jgi:hypothetical protein
MKLRKQYEEEIKLAKNKKVSRAPSEKPEVETRGV